MYSPLSSWGFVEDPHDLWVIPTQPIFTASGDESEDDDDDSNTDIDEDDFDDDFDDNFEEEDDLEE